MKYIIDKNALTRNLKDNVHSREDLCITEDVLDEASATEHERKLIGKFGIEVLKLDTFHLECLKNVMSTHGTNTKLIDLITGKGSADVSVLAYILGERNKPSLFPQEYTIVTSDLELVSVASTYGICCESQIPD